MALQKHSVSIRGHRTSFSLEEDFWLALNKLADETSSSVAALVTRIDAKRSEDENLSSALRLFVLRKLQSKVAENEPG